MINGVRDMERYGTEVPPPVIIIINTLYNLSLGGAKVCSVSIGGS